MAKNNTLKALEGLGGLGRMLAHLDENPEAIATMSILLGPTFNFDSLADDRTKALDFLLKTAVGLGVSHSYASILQGAADVVGLHGVEVSVQDILKASNVSRRTFYQAFKNRDQVLMTLYALIQSAVRISLEIHTKDLKTAEEVFGYISEAYYQLCAAGGDLMSHLTGEALRRSSSLRPLLGDHLDICSSRISSKLAEDCGLQLEPSMVRAYFFTIMGIAQDIPLTPRSTHSEKQEALHSFQSFNDIWLRGLK